MTNSAQQTEEVILLPCWCPSGTRSLRVKPNIDHGDFGCRERGRFVFCGNCWAHGPTSTTDATAIDGWNQSRSITSDERSALQSRVESLEKVLAKVAASHHTDTCDSLLIEGYPCSCHVNIAQAALNSGVTDDTK